MSLEISSLEDAFISIGLNEELLQANEDLVKSAGRISQKSIEIDTDAQQQPQQQHQQNIILNNNNQLDLDKIPKSIASFSYLKPHTLLIFLSSNLQFLGSIPSVVCK